MTQQRKESGENCWSCRKYFTYVQHAESDGYCPHCDSPVDLDDSGEKDQLSKVLPAEPTEEMISSAWREAAGKCDHETLKRVYATMFAEAPPPVLVAQPVQVPEGWKLVPVAPTETMLAAAGDSVILNIDEALSAYKAMLSASPQPESE